MIQAVALESCPFFKEHDNMKSQRKFIKLRPRIHFCNCNINIYIPSSNISLYIENPFQNTQHLPEVVLFSMLKIHFVFWTFPDHLSFLFPIL